VTATVSLVELHAAEWREATDLQTLLEIASDTLTCRHLRLFRASCCAKLLPMLDDDADCVEAVRALELAAEDRIDPTAHNNCVMRMLEESIARIVPDWQDSREQLESICIGYVPGSEHDSPQQRQVFNWLYERDPLALRVIDEVA